MCKCIEDLTEQLKEHNTAFDTVLYLNKDMNIWQSRIKIAMRKIAPRGKKPINLMINYCPFCGEDWCDQTREYDEGVWNGT